MQIAGVLSLLLVVLIISLWLFMKRQGKVNRAVMMGLTEILKRIPPPSSEFSAIRPKEENEESWHGVTKEGYHWSRIPR